MLQTPIGEASGPVSPWPGPCRGRMQLVARCLCTECPALRPGGWGARPGPGLLHRMAPEKSPTVRGTCTRTSALSSGEWLPSRGLSAASSPSWYFLLLMGRGSTSLPGPRHSPTWWLSPFCSWGGEEGQAWAWLSAPRRRTLRGAGGCRALSTDTHLGTQGSGQEEVRAWGRRGRAGCWRGWGLDGWPHAEQQVTTAAPSLVPQQNPRPNPAPLEDPEAQRG